MFFGSHHKYLFMSRISEFLYKNVSIIARMENFIGQMSVSAGQSANSFLNNYLENISIVIKQLNKINVVASNLSKFLLQTVMPFLYLVSHRFRLSRYLRKLRLRRSGKMQYQRIFLFYFLNILLSRYAKVCHGRVCLHDAGGLISYCISWEYFYVSAVLTWSLN